MVYGPRRGSRLNVRQDKAGQPSVPRGSSHCSRFCVEFESLYVGNNYLVVFHFDEPVVPQTGKGTRDYISNRADTNGNFTLRQTEMKCNSTACRRSSRVLRAGQQENGESLSDFLEAEALHQL